jgi:glycosidase
MGDNLDLPGRTSVRTPMQWDGSPNGGFSSANPSKLVRALPDGQWGPLGLNVADQRRDDRSLLRWMQRMITRRRELPELALGRAVVLPGLPPAVLAHRVDGADRRFVAVHNFGPEPVSVRLELDGASLAEISEDDVVDKVVTGDDGTFDIVLAGYGHRWYVAADRV